MPRVSNSDMLVVDFYGLEFDDNDPGKTLPIDLCSDCWLIWYGMGLEIDHPDYSDDEYYCHECGVLLEACDNEY